MHTYTINDIFSISDRYKLFLLPSTTDSLGDTIATLNKDHVPVINVGMELAKFLDVLDDYSYLPIDTFDHIKNLLDSKKLRRKGGQNDVIALYNIGILLEPSLELNTENLLKDFSKSTAVIIIWEYPQDHPDILSWPVANNSLNFSDIHLKKLANAV